MPALCLDPLPLCQETRSASDAFVEGRFGEALESSNRLITEMPREAWFWRFRGECFLFLQRFDDAAECFEQAMSLGASGGTEDTFLWQALALQQAGREAEARSLLMSYLDGSPHRPELALKARTALASCAGG